jgi:hypothetical protein
VAALCCALSSIETPDNAGRHHHHGTGAMSPAHSPVPYEPCLYQPPLMRPRPRIAEPGTERGKTCRRLSMPIHPWPGPERPPTKAKVSQYAILPPYVGAAQPLNGSSHPGIVGHGGSGLWRIPDGDTDRHRASAIRRPTRASALPSLHWPGQRSGAEARCVRGGTYPARSSVILWSLPATGDREIDNRNTNCKKVFDKSARGSHLSHHADRRKLRIAPDTNNRNRWLGRQHPLAADSEYVRCRSQQKKRAGRPAAGHAHTLKFPAIF